MGLSTKRSRGAVISLLVLACLLLPPLMPMAQTADGPGPGNDDGPFPPSTSGRQAPAPGPDLIVTNISLSVEDPVDGSLITFFATVENTGQEPAKDFTIAMYARGQQISTMQVTSLGPGNTTTSSAEVQALAGLLEIKAVADLHDQVKEVSEADNFLVRTISVPSPDLYFSDLSYYPANYSDGDSVLVTATVVNGGADTTNPFTCMLLVDDDVIRSKIFYGLGAGDSLVISGEWTSSSGSHEALARADTGGDVRELNESNNILLRPLSTSYPDLAIDIVSVTPDLGQVIDGDRVTIEATVRNLGNDSHNAFPVGFSVDGQEHAGSVMNGLEANGTRDISFEWVAKGGDHEIRVAADGGNKVVESNEGNNFRLLSVDIPLPDLQVISVTSSPYYPMDGSGITVSAQVRNGGPGGTNRTFYVQFYSEGSLLGQVDVPGGIRSNGTTDANFTFVASAGTSQVAAIVDGSSSVPEVEKGNNAGFTTVVVPFPDLSLTNMTITSGLRDGEVGQVKVTVVNNGPGNTSTFFFVDFVVDGETIARVPLQGLPIGVPQVVATDFMAQGGEQVISVRADGGAAIKEADETNNIIQMAFTTGLPDLVLEDVAWVPASPAVGETVTITALLDNIGSPTERPVFVEFMMDGTVIGSTTVLGPSLTGGSSVNAQWRVTGLEGRLEARIDGPMQVPELDETNNNMTRAFPAGSIVARSPGPDLVVTRLSWLPLAPSDGEEVSIIVSVENQGAIPDPGPDGKGALVPGITVYVDNQKVASTTMKLLSTEAVAVIPWTAASGDHVMRAVIDVGRTNAETNETNNALSMNLTVARPDISLSNLEFIPANPDDGNTVSIFVRVDDLGDRTIRGFSLHYLLDGIYIGKEEVEGALLNKSTTVTHSWKATPGQHRVTVVADPYGALVELDEANNALSGNITIRRPNLQIISIDTATLVDDGSQSLVTARVRNTGQGSTVRDFLVSFYIDGEEMGSQSVVGLPAGNEVVVSRSMSPGPGAHHLRVVVDPAGGVMELDETDNALVGPELNVTFSDLTVTDVRIMSQDDSSSIIFASLMNLGNTTTRTFGVAFYSDGELIGTKRFDGLPGGFGTTVGMTWPHLFGAHRVRVVIDPWGTISETNEANNELVLITPSLSYPDLYIDEVDIVGPTVPGAEIKFVATVRNIGGETRTPFSVRFSIDGEQLGEAPVRGLPKDGQAIVSFKTSGVVGQHHLRVEADPSDLVPERNEMNNAQSTTYSIGAPDLRITEIQVYAHSKGVAIFAKVRNDGTHMLSPAVVSFYGDGELVGESLIRGLPALSSTMVMAVIPADTENVRVVADGRGEIPEKIDNNNDRDLRVRPNPVEGDLDLAVTDIFWVPQFPVDGEEVTFFAIVENLGNGTVVEDIPIDFQYNGVTHGTGHMTGLPEGGTGIVSSSFQVGSGKNINITASVDRDDIHAETMEGNNNFTTWMNISSAELKVISVRYSDAYFGEDTVVFVTIDNEGDGDLIRQFSTNIYVEGDLESSDTSNCLPAGSSTTLAFKVKRSWGEKELLVVTDAKSQVKEADEDNDRLSRLDLGYPDLVVTDVWYETGVNSSTAAAFAQVRNLGAGIGTDLQVRMYVNGIDLGPKVLHGLENNSTAVLPWTFGTTEVARITASVDDNNIVPESNELNNHFERNATGNATYMPPDINLEVTSLNITQYGTPKNHYRLSAVVENQGQDISAMTVKFVIDGRTFQEVPIEPLKGNTTKAVTVLWEGQPDRHVFKVIADSDRTVAEYEEVDNEVRVDLAANFPPIAYPGNNQSITLGDKASLKARGFDPDGRIVRYEWDFDGDGDWDWVSNESSNIEHRYSKLPPGKAKYFNATLRVTDDRGAMSTATVAVKVTEKKPWYRLPEGARFAQVAAGISGVVVILLSIVVAYYFTRKQRPFKETPDERKRRQERERRGEGRRIWPWKRRVSDYDDIMEKEGT
jgi:subtilase family serine protease